MAADEAPQLYLITPPDPGAPGFADRLSTVLDTAEIACLRLRMASTDPGAIGRAADALREIAHARDLPLVIEAHAGLVAPHGLDGVHLSDGPRSIRAARQALGADAIVGASCGASRHDGMTAGEAGADYVAFGPAGPSPLGTGGRAEHDLFAWWSEMIELPVVAEGALNPALAANLAPVVDFLALGDEVWGAEDPAATLAAFAAAIR